MAQLLNLNARAHPSRVLDAWLSGRAGAHDRAGVEPRAQTVMSSDSAGMRELFAPISSSAGVAVNERTAMQVSTVFACLAKLAGAITQLPIHQYRVDGEGQREQMQPTPLWWMLNESPTAQWTAASWKEFLVKCVHLRGDHITEILRNGSSPTVAGLRPLHPDNVTWEVVNRRLHYYVQDPETGRAYGLDQDDVLHFAGFGFDGLRSMSVISWAARQSIGNSIAAADFAGRTLGENAMPKIALTYPNKMSPDQAQTVRQNFVDTYGGAAGRKMPLVLTEGAQAKELSISPVDLELMAMRRFDKGEICEAFGVPPIIIGDSEKTSSWGTGIEQIMLGFVRFTIKPHLVRWEEEFNRKLFRRAGQFVEHSLDALLDGDAKSQSDHFRAALGGPGSGNGWMTVNEVRRRKNLPPVEGGDKIFEAQAKGAGAAADGGPPGGPPPRQPVPPPPGPPGHSSNDQGTTP
jgi:HK97 family phage portal protein